MLFSRFGFFRYETEESTFSFHIQLLFDKSYICTHLLIMVTYFNLKCALIYLHLLFFIIL